MLNTEEYERALARIQALMQGDPAPDTDEGRALVTLVDCVLEYEQQHFPEFSVRSNEARCKDGEKHDFTGPVYERRAEDGSIESGPTCIKCGQCFGDYTVVQS